MTKTNAPTAAELNCEELVKLHDALDVPVLENVCIGQTGYLDRTKPEDMTAPVMKGRDSNGRRFIALRVTQEIGSPKDGSKNIKRNTVLMVFERYSDAAFPWVTAIADGAPIASEEHHYLPDCARLKRLIAGSTMVHEQDFGGHVCVKTLELV